MATGSSRAYFLVFLRPILKSITLLSILTIVQQQSKLKSKFDDYSIG